MAATVYDPSTKYLPFLPKKKKEGCDCGKKKHEGHEEGCGCEQCSCDCDKKDCGCCPPGLVSAFGDNNEFLGCLTPNDAELFQKNTFTCLDGYVKLFRNTDGSFLGCVAAADFAALYSQVNP